jgi:hypothetical protein
LNAVIIENQQYLCRSQTKPEAWFKTEDIEDSPGKYLRPLLGAMKNAQDLNGPSLNAVSNNEG